MMKKEHGVYGNRNSMETASLGHPKVMKTCGCCGGRERYLLKFSIKVFDDTNPDGFRNESIPICKRCLLEAVGLIDAQILSDCHADEAKD